MTSNRAADFAYPVGDTDVIWTATDAAGNIATATQTVTVNDVEKPVIVSNGDKFVNSDAGQCGAFVAVSATASDNCTVGAPIGTRGDNLALTDLFPFGTTIITWKVTDNNLNIYPNPFSETIHISVLNNLKLEKAIIYDLVGNEIISSNKNEIDASSLKSGIYLIMIVDNIGNSYSKKLVKN